MSIPSLRFKIFDDPWNNHSLSETNITVSDGNYGPLYPKANQFIDKGIPFVRANNFNNGRLTWNDMRFISKELHMNLTSGHLIEKDILVTTRGVGIGSIAFVDSEFEGSNINAQICLLRDSKILNQLFLFYSLSTHNAKKQFSNLTTGSALPQLPRKNLVRISFGIPNIKEQQNIADFLGSVDAKLDTLRRKRNLLAGYKRGVMQKIFSQEIRFVDEDGQSFPDWKYKTMGEITSFLKDGTHGTHQNIKGSGYLLLSAKNIQNGGVIWDASDREISKKEFDGIYTKYTLKKNDILLTIVGTIGRVALFVGEENIAFQRSVGFFRLIRDITQFIFQQMNAFQFQKELKRRQVTSAQPGIYLNELSLLPIKIPSLFEQQKIADFLTGIDMKITTVEGQINRVEVFKKGLLQQMFV